MQKEEHEKIAFYEASYVQEYFDAVQEFINEDIKNLTKTELVQLILDYQELFKLLMK